MQRRRESRSNPTPAQGRGRCTVCTKQKLKKRNDEADWDGSVHCKKSKEEVSDVRKRQAGKRQARVYVPEFTKRRRGISWGGQEGKGTGEMEGREGEIGSRESGGKAEGIGKKGKAARDRPRPRRGEVTAAALTLEATKKVAVQRRDNEGKGRAAAEYRETDTRSRRAGAYWSLERTTLKGPLYQASQRHTSKPPPSSLKGCA
ncbi:hypothetical protein K438DRAFT_1949459 [Mycena galopus ATCC 62051]|nr:hypothetical protein K438DRAFT_1949459 [Mycena galopus ATCC 62051]